MLCAAGIGLAAAMRFAALGMKVCIADVGTDRLAEAERLSEPLERLRQRDIFHQRDLGEAADSLEPLAAHEHRLVARRDAAEPPVGETDS